MFLLAFFYEALERLAQFVAHVNGIGFHVEVLADLHRAEVRVERAVGPSGSGGELASEHARMALHPPGLHLDERVERAAVLSLAVDGGLNTEIAANCFHKIGQLALLQPESAFRWVI